MSWIGRWIIGVGVIHSLFGLYFMRPTLKILWSEGVFNTVNGQPPREAVFWFLCTGVMMIIVGVLVHHAEREGHEIPGFVVAVFAALTVVAVAVMPISGVWLLIPPALGMVFSHRRRRTRNVSTAK